MLNVEFDINRLEILDSIYPNLIIIIKVFCNQW